ncbi:MAG: ABC transporter ATP-binding protein [Clostridia bacterium]|nr:ABC transporter ATP-binding protein [Clostridia bacterium]
MLADPRTQKNPNNSQKAKKLDKKTRRMVLLRLGKYLFKHKLILLIAFVLMISSNVLALFGPKLSGLAINAIEPGAGQVDIPTATYYVILMAIFYVLSALFSLLLALTLVKLGQRITYTLRRDLFEHLLTLPVGYFDRHQTGDIISHISYDVDTVNTSLSHDLLQICASVITVVGSVAMMLSISPVLVLVFVITVPISLLIARRRTTKVRPLFRRRSAKLGELNGYAEEMLSGQKTIHAYGRENTISTKFDEKNAEACAAYYEADYHGAAIGPSVNFINNLSISLIIMLGGIFYMLSLTGVVGAGSVFFIELGFLSSFVQYSRRFSGPINEFANILADLQSALAAAERIFRILDEAPEREDAPDARTLESVTGEVDFENVKFGYLPEKTIIKNLTLKVKPGSTVAIVGPTGAGKTTIINLLMRFYDVDSGEIRIDGTALPEITRASLRAAYTMVLQDTWLFGGSVAENIAYGREGATREEIIAAARAAKIDTFIDSLPDGYDTVLTDNGVSISKGQKQLITIARAMLADSPMLILDEATSNVDSRTEQQIGEAMLRLMHGRTCFVIAHRLSTIQNADVILVVKDGNVIEQGDHATLLAAGGFYASLYNSQFA